MSRLLNGRVGVSHLLFYPTATPQKRQHSDMSSPAGSPIQNNPPSYKRIRLMSDSSTDGESSSQGQVTSPTKVVDELPFVDKVTYLHTKFPTYTKEVGKMQVLNYNSPCVSATSNTHLSYFPTSLS